MVNDYETRSEAEEDVRRIAKETGRLPCFFGHVRIRFGEKYMVDYEDPRTRDFSAVTVLEDLTRRIPRKRLWQFSR